MSTTTKFTFPEAYLSLNLPAGGPSWVISTDLCKIGTQKIHLNVPHLDSQNLPQYALSNGDCVTPN